MNKPEAEDDKESQEGYDEEAEMAKEPEADDDGKEPTRRIPNNIVRENSAIMFDLLKAELEAADWEDGPWKSTKPFKGITNPAGCNNRENYREDR